jgi:hypothetical protein
MKWYSYAQNDNDPNRIHGHTLAGVRPSRYSVGFKSSQILPLVWGR